MILKVLLVLTVIAVVYFMFIKKKPTNISTKDAPGNTNNSKADEMVECNSCGVYAPLNESILSGGKYYCSNECLNK